MGELAPVVIAAAVLAIGTYAMRLVGVILGSRREVPERTQALLNRAVIVLLVSVLAATAVYDGQEATSIARPIGVGVGGVLALINAPLAVVVVAAMLVTALLRLIGLP